MPELDPRTDFRDDGGTPMWRIRQRTTRRPLSIVEAILWFLVYPFFALFTLYVGSLLLGYAYGMSLWTAVVAVGAVLIYLPVNYFTRRR